MCVFVCACSCHFMRGCHEISRSTIERAVVACERSPSPCVFMRFKHSQVTFRCGGGGAHDRDRMRLARRAVVGMKYVFVCVCVCISPWSWHRFFADKSQTQTHIFHSRARAQANTIWTAFCTRRRGRIKLVVSKASTVRCGVQNWVYTYYGMRYLIVYNCDRMKHTRIDKLTFTHTERDRHITHISNEHDVVSRWGSVWAVRNRELLVYRCEKVCSCVRDFCIVIMHTHSHGAWHLSCV